ncbi:hypothetical protein OF829_12265 [Sphingomonas sp. LB-2]|uniref:hypothetical protein n=1 Tax=Sphingomonas caeni TaxID=2984949 RepID=UPI0022307885|nr:hypothetical protein [Sphingomonas caeni]MCW3848015.1 hypothetical protein [Sphingomonas caeni]
MPKLLWPGAAAIVIALVALLLIPSAALPALKLNPNMAQAAGVTIGALAAIAAILERALAVFTDLLFGQERSEARHQLNALRLAVPVPPPPAPGATPAALAAAQASSVQAQTDARTAMAPALATVADIDARRERARLLLGFAASFLISAAGVRTLTGLVADGVTLTSYATMVDIMLTAGLLAGGSNALAKLADLIQEGANQRLNGLRTQ